MLNSIYSWNTSLNLSIIREAPPWQTFKDTPVMKDYLVWILPAARCQNRTRDNWVGSSNVTSMLHKDNSASSRFEIRMIGFFFDPGWRVFFHLTEMSWFDLRHVCFHNLDLVRLSGFKLLRLKLSFFHLGGFRKLHHLLLTFTEKSS